MIRNTPVLACRHWHHLKLSECSLQAFDCMTALPEVCATILSTDSGGTCQVTQRARFESYGARLLATLVCSPFHGKTSSMEPANTWMVSATTSSAPVGMLVGSSVNASGDVLGPGTPFRSRVLTFPSSSVRILIRWLLVSATSARRPGPGAKPLGSES